MHLGFTEMHVLNGLIFGLLLRIFFRLRNGLNHMWAAHKPFATLFSSFVVHVLGHDGSYEVERGAIELARLTKSPPRNHGRD
jgi:hypothetical protein